MNNSVETINAAATAIVAHESRIQQATRRKWGGCLSIYWCFGSPRHGKRIGHSVLVPEPTVPGNAPSSTGNDSQPPALALPFVAPPSSPASFLHSEPPSATQSPAVSYSPSGPHSIFAIGPYAHETQLVSPPVFSTLTTEPSTAPFTPPPEPVQLTTPPSPEVPFAKLLTSSLDSTHKSNESCQKFPSPHYEFHSYQLYPGSPVGHLISPSSAISGSGTSSPFPDVEFQSGGCSFPPFHASDPPKLSSLDGLFIRKLVPVPHKDPGSTTLNASRPKTEEALTGGGQIPEVASLANIGASGPHDDELVVGHRVSFELNAEEVSACVRKELPSSDRAASEPSLQPTVATAEGDRLCSESSNVCECLPDQTSNRSVATTPVGGEKQTPQPSTTIEMVKEFKFDNADGASAGPPVGSDWWANERANEKVVGAEAGPKNNWSFFPIVQPGVS